uniref:Transducin beta-like protein 3 n=1 Tax=Ascaris suum TaxID=6253 RepID=F1KV63_ASCSU
MNEEVADLALVHSIETFYTGGSVEWSTDGDTIFTTCTNVVKALRIDDGTTRYVIGEDDDASHVSCVQCSPDSHSMIVAYTNGLLREYILPAKTAIDAKAQMNRQWRSTHTAPIKLIRFSSNATMLATGSADFTLKVWKLESQCCVASLKGPTAVTQALFVDGERILIGYMDGSVNFYRLKGEKRLMHHWKYHTSQVVSILLLERTLVATVSRDQTISLISLETNERVKTLPLFEPVESALLIDDGTMLTVGEEGVLKCWQPTTGKLLRSSNICNCRIDSILRNRIRRQLLLISCDSNLYLVDEKTFDVRRQMVGFNDEIFDLTFVGANRQYMVVAANSTDIRIYETQTWACHLVPGHTGSILCASNASWDANIFATSSKDNSFVVWKICEDEKGFSLPQKVGVATGHTNNVTAVRFSRTSKKHFIVSVSNDTTLKLWSLADVKPGSECVKLSASSTLVAHTKDVTCVDVSVNDRLCVTGSLDKTAKLWHIDPTKMQLGIAGTLAGHRRGVWDARFSSSTQIVATCSGDCMVRVFSLGANECIATLSGHPSAVLKAVFVNNSKQLISADSGGLLKIWSISAKECISTVEAHDDKIWAMLAYDDESRFVTAGSDGRIRIWEDVTEKKREEEEEKRTQRIKDEQKLSNLMEQKRYAEALSFSLTLSRPFNCLKVVNALLEMGGMELRNSVADLLEEQLVILLDFASQWNTNSRTSNASQQVLYEILHCYTPEQLLKTPNIASVVESFIPYTNRHFERLTRSRQNAAFLHYTWSQMRLPDADTQAA